MPEENADIVRAAFDAYQRGDEAAMLALTSPEVTGAQALGVRARP